ncbi:MAG: 16S rRNA (guanine(966)-N(2))-methyltransferase RsmD [Lachnospiraceae bacterium]|nr:16S rRNA (guanine(966)-N(2))-methyltransferase RsmD [Lachnospiraceae bacterium]
MRVIAGSARSLALKTIEGLGTRPTTDRIKETLFNMLNKNIPDCYFVDVFSGSGGIGIEALSRGAKKCVFIENNKDAAKCIKDNLKFTKLEENATVLECDYLSGLSIISKKDEPIDIIFMDPPYNMEYERKALDFLKDKDIIDEYTTIIVEASLETEMDYVRDMGFNVYKVKEYKTNKHIFIEKKV